MMSWLQGRPAARVAAACRWCCWCGRLLFSSPRAFPAISSQMLPSAPHALTPPSHACRVEREEQSAKGPLEALADTLKGAADFVK